MRTIPREDSLSTKESPMLENLEGVGNTIEMETCGEEPRVNVGNQGADDMDVLDTALETPKPPRNMRETYSYARVSECSGTRHDRLLG